MRILYATDGSEGGLNPARFLAGLPHRPDIHVHILTVLDSDDNQDGSAVLASAEAALEGFPGHMTTATATGDSTSEVVEALLRIADDTDADLIAVGANGRSAIARFFLGSVAEAVARYAARPVLVTRPLTSPLREVIVGVDGSDGGRAAAEFAASQLPLPPVCALRLASVLPQSLFGVVGDPLYPGTIEYMEMEMSNRKARDQALVKAEALAVTLRNANDGSQIEVEPVALGNPAEELMRIAEERNAVLIVVGSQGMTGIERFLLGGVSERVMRHAPCSVLIVK